VLEKAAGFPVGSERGVPILLHSKGVVANLAAPSPDPSRRSSVLNSATGTVRELAFPKATGRDRRRRVDERRIILGMAAYSVIHSPGLLRVVGAGMAVLLAISPLVIGIRSLRYCVRVSNDELTISDFTTKSVPLRVIGEVFIGVSRASSFCQIRLITGEEDLKVASDLEHFPEFVSLLSENVNASKTDS
jgi:hypothetical protein